MSRRLELPVRRPFDWPSLMAFLHLRATPGVEAVRDGVYTRTFGTPAHPHTLSVGYDPGKSCLRVEHSGSPGDSKEITARIRQLFRAETDTAPIENFLRKDRWLGGFVRRQTGLRVPGGWAPFEIALRAVMGQQVSVPAATTLMGRLMRAAATWSSETSCIFPSPEQVLRADIRRLGMPAKRLETVKALARFFAEHSADAVAEENAFERLLTVPGIGRWTAGYILMRASGNGEGGDHWPEGDLILRKALSAGKQMIPHAEAGRIFEQWKPWRSYATLHIWKGYDGTNPRKPPQA